MVPFSGPVDWEPFGVLVPTHPPLPAHDVTSLLFQESTADSPDVTDIGETNIDTMGIVATGSGPGVTETVADAAATPPIPVHVMMYVVAIVREPVSWEPVVVLIPPHPPEATQVVAFVLDHVSLEEPPDITEAGSAEIMTVGVEVDVGVEVAMGVKEGAGNVGRVGSGNDESCLTRRDSAVQPSTPTS